VRARSQRCQRDGWWRGQGGATAAAAAAATACDLLRRAVTLRQVGVGRLATGWVTQGAGNDIFSHFTLLQTGSYFIV
jgi:hypothetical protein